MEISRYRAQTHVLQDLTVRVAEMSRAIEPKIGIQSRNGFKTKLQIAIRWWPTFRTHNAVVPANYCESQSKRNVTASRGAHCGSSQAVHRGGRASAASKIARHQKACLRLRRRFGLCWAAPYSLHAPGPCSNAFLAPAAVQSSVVQRSAVQRGALNTRRRV